MTIDDNAATDAAEARSGTSASDEIALVFGRLDAFCEAWHRLAETARQDRWPDSIANATIELGGHIELLLSALNVEERDPPALREVITEARDRLPEEFSTFAKALAHDLDKLLEHLPPESRSLAAAKEETEART